jgi:hypothetical protein
MTRATGFLPDPQGHRYTSFKATRGHGLKAAAPRPRPVHFAAPVSNQGPVGQCVAHGLLDAGFAALRAFGVAIETPFSHRLGYLLARAIDRAAWVPMNQALPPLQDDGSQPNQLVRALALYGCPLAKDVDGGTLDAIPELANREIQLSESIACNPGRWPLDFSCVGDNDADKLDQCQAALEGGLPFALAIEAGPKFDACDGSTVLSSDGLVLNHMIHCLDVTTDISGRRWLVQNSWGEGWGAFGRAWVNDGFIEAAGNILIPRVTT